MPPWSRFAREEVPGLLFFVTFVFLFVAQPSARARRKLTRASDSIPAAESRPTPPSHRSRSWQAQIPPLTAKATQSD
ncbi:hypothetical protein B0H14DRAFT_2910668 [Mycena olivaceomarginata]|nr:hypothetical protein B0H14DRAFT_2910668 [Mycena olivaceomarginata]